MFHRVTCPSCQHKFTIPEGDVGKLANCPNCQSPFKAGKSVAEAEVPMKLQIPPVAAGINKTMLGETEPPIKYNCPRCKKPLESPSIEAGTKKPCPACGQRLQVPAAPRPVAPVPAINKTMLAVDESIQPMQQPMPMATAPSAPPPPRKKADPDDKPQPSGSGRFYTMATLFGGGIFLLSILACVGVIMVSGGESAAMKKAREDFAKAQQDLEAWKKDAQQKEALMAQQKLYEAKEKQLWDKFLEEQRIQQQKWDYQRELDLKAAAAQNDKALQAKLEEDRRRKQEEVDRITKEKLADKERADADTRAKLQSLQSQLDAANQKAQQATIIVSQPPPPPYYPPYSPYSWRHWGW